MDVSLTYGSAYSFLHINNCSSFDDVINDIERLKQVFILFDFSKNNKIQFSNDYSDFKINGVSLEDNFLELTNDPSAAIYLLDCLEKAVGDKKSYLSTELMELNLRQNANNSFVYEYPFSLDVLWPSLTNKNHVYDYFDVCNFNSFNLKSGVEDAAEFVKKATNIYEHIQFSNVFEEKLSTIKNGDVLNYVNVFSHALNVLNQAFFKVSNDESRNDDDLNIISGLSKSKALRGRGLDCTRQGANKPHFTFPEIDNPQSNEIVNCEYHLKIDYADNGVRLNSSDYVRVYFGLKYNEKYDRKYIRLGYIGEHWPPRKSGKK